MRYLSDRIAVMYLGRIMELGTTEQIFAGPNHPYTEALLSAVPSVDGEVKQRIPLSGEIPSPANPPSGCVFHTRCHRFIEGLCDVTEPATIELGPEPLLEVPPRCRPAERPVCGRHLGPTAGDHRRGADGLTTSHLACRAARLTTAGVHPSLD